MASNVKRKPPRVAIVDNSIDPSVYTPVAHWTTCLDVPVDSFRAPDGVLPDLKKGYTHIILTGSEASIVEREPWVEEEVAFVRRVLETNIPILGSCYGHQLLVLALRGPDRVRRCARPEVGWLPIRVVRRSALLGECRTIYAFSSHFDEVTGLDRDFRILASTPGCEVQAFELVGRPVWGIQFHPEISVAAARDFMGKILRQKILNATVFEAALAQTPRDSGVIRRIVRTFLAATPGGTPA